MYCKFYHLAVPPFQQGTESSVLWEGRNYLKSLEALKYGLAHHAGLSLLTGDAGSGKTTVIRALLSSLDQTVQAALISVSSLSVQEFYDLVAHSFSLSGKIKNRDALHRQLGRLLKQTGTKNKQLLLVVDEAQQLSTELLEEIDGLLHLQTADSDRLNVCLVGQLDATRGAGKRIDQSFANHVMVRYVLAPFTLEETSEYVRYHLRAAGSKGEIFTQDAFAAVQRYSGGLPGRINIICDLALFDGFNQKSQEITAAIIQTSAEKLQFPELQEKDKPQYVSNVSFEPEPRREIGDAVDGAVLEKTPGNSYVLPVLAVFAGLIVLAGGYAYYIRQPQIVLPLEPTAAGRPLPVAQEISIARGTDTTQHEKLFDAVGYSPPREDLPLTPSPSLSPSAEDEDLVRSVPSQVPIVVAADAGSITVQEKSLDEQPVVQENDEVKELQVEKSLAVESVASVQKASSLLSEGKEDTVDPPSGRIDEAAEVVTVSNGKEVPSVPVAAETIEQESETVVQATQATVVEDMVEEQSVVVDPVPVVLATVTEEKKKSISDIDRERGVSVPAGTVSEVPVKAPGERVAAVKEPLSVVTVETLPSHHTLPDEYGCLNLELDPASGQERGRHQASHQVKFRAGQGREAVLKGFQTDDEYGAGEITGTPQGRSVELEGFFEAGAFVKPPPSSLPENKAVKKKRPTQVAVAPAPKEKIVVKPQVNKPQVKPEPQPEDVIDWLLKRREENAQ